MKVGTDGVILGAWTEVGSPGKPMEERDSARKVPESSPREKSPSTEKPNIIPAAPGNHPEEVWRALDVGTGTGLLALMLAQRSDRLLIDAIEIDPAAAQQAAENVAGSVFADRIRVQQGDFRDFDPGPEVHYDLVICNPPYFSHSRKTADTGRNLARHSDSLDLARLFSGAAKLLSKYGKISIIVPSDQASSAKDLAGSHGLFPERILEVMPVPGAVPKRHCLQFSRSRRTPVAASIVIEEYGRQGYSDAYRALTKDFYLEM